MRERIGQLLREYRAGLEQVYGPRLRGVYLYGSYARGDANADSDIDILVVLDDFESYYQEIQRTGHMSADLALKYEVTVSEVFMREREWQLGDTPFLASVRLDAVPA